MSQNTGTLVAAPIRPNDSNDQYAAAFQSEIKGGHHTRTTVAARDAIGAWLREAGMTCYVIADGNTYELDNDLVTWRTKSAPGGGPGSGGDNTNTQLISGNFGAWIVLGSYHAAIVDQLQLQYKTDLVAFPSRAITYLQGQFSLDAGFTGTTITLGTIPANSRPKAQIKKYFITNNVEMFLVVETGGNVKLQSKDGLNLPAGESTQPFYIDTFFNPEITTEESEIFTATRTANFTRNTCGPGYTGGVTSFSKTYTSTVSQDVADALAAGDDTFNTEGQSEANDGVCTLNPTENVRIYNGRGEGTQSIAFTPVTGPVVNSAPVYPGANGVASLVTDDPYTVTVTNLSGISAASVNITALHGFNQTKPLPAGGTATFTNVHPLMEIHLS